MKTLITLLGTAPGTATAAYYALCEQKEYGPPERIVVVATDARETKECLKMIRGELSRLEPAGPRLEEVIVPIPDLEDDATTKEFQAQVAAVLRRERDRPGNQVWLSIAGGRKSMAALAAMAAQLIGVDKMFHIYVARELEQHGDINQLLLDPGWQPRCLHPKKGKYTLVEVPFFELSVEQGQLRLLLEGRPDAFAHEIIRANPAILTQLPGDVVRAYWAYVIEEYGRPPQYEDLTVRIGPRPSPDADFPVTAYGDGTGDVSSDFVPLFTPAQVQAVVEAMSEQHPTAEQQEAARDWGQKLFNGLFSGELLRTYYLKQGWVANEGRHLRLRLRLADDARLDGLPLRQVPWELLHDGRDFLGLRRDHSIVRHPETDEPAGPLPVKRQLRVLVAAASPGDQIGLPEGFELGALYTGVQQLAPRLAVDGLDDPPSTFDALKHRLAEIHPCHVFYFTGHGEPGGLVFEKDDGTSDARSAGEVAALLMGQEVRLVVLNACYGAQAPAPDIASVAQALVEAGLPAVVAMQSAILTGKVWYAPAVRFANEFFFHLALGWPVDACVTEARLQMQNALPESFQWATPVCFMRAGDGRLFSFEND